MRTVSPFLAAIVKCDDMTSGKQCRADGCQAKAAYITMSDAGHEPTCEAHTVEYAQVNDIRGFCVRSSPRAEWVRTMKERYTLSEEELSVPSQLSRQFTHPGKPEFPVKHSAKSTKLPQKREAKKAGNK